MSALLVEPDAVGSSAFQSSSTKLTASLVVPMSTADSVSQDLTACLHYRSIYAGSIWFESFRSAEPVYTSGAGSVQLDSWQCVYISVS